MSYKIQTTNGERTITIADQEINYETSIVLFGRKTENWGEIYNTNILRILENFCNDYPPGYSGQVLEGQLWFDSHNKQLNICTNTAPLEWDIIANVDSPDVDGVVTTDLLAKRLLEYIPLAGNDIPMTGQLLSNPVISTSSNNTAVTKKYIDSLVCSCSFNGTDWKDEYAKAYGDTISTKIILDGNYSQPEYAVGAGYLDSISHFTVTASTNVTVNGAIKDYIAVSTIESEAIPVVYVTGSVTFLPNSTTCTITLPYVLSNPYFINVSGVVIDGKDTVGTNDTGTHCNAFWTAVTNKSFTITIPSVGFNTVVYFTVHGNKA
jgi:hypothetical protein